MTPPRPALVPCTQRSRGQLRGIAAGVEVSCRLSTVVPKAVHKAGFHPTAVFGAMGARDEHTLKAFLEAEAYEGVSLIIAYSHCIAHGYDLAFGLDQQKLAVETGPAAAYYRARIRLERREAHDESPAFTDLRREGNVLPEQPRATKASVWAET